MVSQSRLPVSVTPAYSEIGTLERDYDSRTARGVAVTSSVRHVREPERTAGPILTRYLAGGIPCGHKAAMTFETIIAKCGAKRVERCRRMVQLICGGEVTAIQADRATIRAGLSRSELTYLRSPRTGVAALWESSARQATRVATRRSRARCRTTRLWARPVSAVRQQADSPPQTGLTLIKEQSLH